MSDKVDDIDKHYRRDVLPDDVPRTFALFSIPEYPELEAGEGMWAVCLDALLTALRYLAPATLLTIFWGQQSFFFRILRHIDLAFRAIVFSSDEQKQSVLKWIAEAGPVRVEHLDTVWRHGWILCGVLDAALPGACAGHPPTRQTLKHAQTIADHYLGVDPVFSRQELESNDCLCKHQEWKLAHYLERVRTALAKIPPPVSKPTSQRTSPEAIQFNLDYIARGSGLAAAQINHKMYFKIYPNAQQSLEPGDVTVLIRGPKDTYGMVVIPPILGKAQSIRQKLLNLQAARQYTENALPITQGATYLRTYGRTDINKMYHIPKTKYDIEMKVESHEDCAKVGYLVNLEGKYEISIVSRGHGIIGTPFTVTASNNIVETLEKESFCLEDGEEIDIVDVKTERKVVLRIVDFVTEKMLLNENGSLEKISNDEANILMATDKTEQKAKKSDLSSPEYDNLEVEAKEKTKGRVSRFKQVASQVKSLINACKAFYEVIHKKGSQENKWESEEIYVRPQSRQGIPDVVNSTFNDSMSQYEKTEKFEIVLRPNYCSTKSIINTKPLRKNEEYELNNAKDCINKSDLELTNKLNTDVNNPFLNVYEEDIVSNKAMSVEKTEDLAHFAETDAMDDLPIKIVIQENEDESISPTSNPFIEPELLERPKTPVLKIITGEVKDRVDSVYVDPHIEQITEEILGNEFTNPFFMHEHQTSEHEKQEPATTFIIGAPVSLPPIVTASSPDPDMSSIMITSNDQSLLSYEVNENVPTRMLHTKVGETSTTSSTFHSLDSNVLEGAEDILIDSRENRNEFEISLLKYSKTIESTKKDMWDSAYVSIDENHSSPDTNNNDNTAMCEATCKAKFSPSEETILKQEDYIRMGPAEKELWASCTELTSVPKMTEEFKSPRWERRPIFTPIIEESDRSMSGNLKESGRSTKHSDIDPVTVAFAELNEIFQEYNSTSEQSSLTTSGDYILDHSHELEYTIEMDDMRVESASERVSDVMRPTTIQEQGEISEVQQNVTESISVSQILPLKLDHNNESTDFDNLDEIKFGKHKGTNIVTEKKKYWDERIREIEETRSEQAKKKKLISKNLRHNDSLSKRRGKQIIKHFLIANEIEPVSSTKSLEKPHKYGPELHTKISEYSDVKLVEKWKKYWDEKLETEKDDIQVACFGTASYRNRHELSHSPQSNTNSNNDSTISSPDLGSITQSDGENNPTLTNLKLKTSTLPTNYSNSKHKEKTLSSFEDTEIGSQQKSSTPKDVFTTKIKEKSATLPIKQELPEEVFKAFETSPKRFFGTSRKQILNKIDAFLGKPSTADEITTCPEDISGASHEKGLVSSRVSMFHNISHVEDLPWKCSKSTSLLNISHSKASENDMSRKVSQTISPEPVRESGDGNIRQMMKKTYSSENDSFKSNDESKCPTEISMTDTTLSKDSENDNDLIKCPCKLTETLKESSLNTVQDKIKAYLTEIDSARLKNQWNGGKSASMLNVRQRKDSGKDSIVSKLSSISLETMKEIDQNNTVKNKIKEISIKTENRIPYAVNVGMNTILKPTLGAHINVKKTENDINCQTNKVPKINYLRKSTVSKSEMDIFSKVTEIDVDDNLHKHKSYDVLPKPNVKNFINIYETVAKTAKLDSKPLMRRLSRSSSMGSDKLARINSSITRISTPNSTIEDSSVMTSDDPIIQISPKPPPRKRRGTNKSNQESLDIGDSVESINFDKISKYKEFQNNCTRKERYISLSDIEVEIIENGSEKMYESSPDRETDEKEDGTDADYKSRFKLAKQYFQSLEELRSEDNKRLKLNECEQLLLKQSVENNIKTRNRVKKNVKSRSMDSSELAKIWSELKVANADRDSKFVKISEKFNVEDLFTDVTEGKLSRQGSLRGIPHKKAVLEAFRSMENVSDTKLSSYEIAISQLADFAKENKIKNVQTYLTEYPYLPTTEPSKYHSRLDAKASGLISMKELLNNKPRRNSVPDIRMNPTFTVDL